MTQRTLIHVGLPKTGTTFLQKSVFPNLEETFFSEKSSRRLRWLLAGNDTIEHKSLVRLAETLTAEPRVLISNEGLIGEPQRSLQHHHGQAVRMQELFPEAEILMVVRRQDRYVESMYRQVIQQGWFHPLDQFLLHEKDREHRRWYPFLHLDDLNWYAYVRSYQRLFGRSRVHVMVYENFVEDRDRFLAELGELIGEQLTVREAPEGSDNRSLSDRSIRIARYLNRLYRYDNRLGGLIGAQRAYRRAKAEEKTPETGQLTRRARFFKRLQPRYLLPRLESRAPGARQLLDERRAEEILARHRKSNRKLAEMAGLDLAAHGYY